MRETPLSTRACERGRLWLAACLVLASTVAHADAPVSVGNAGAVERQQVNAAGPGSRNPAFDPVGQKEESKFSLKLRYPLWQDNDSAATQVIPVEKVPEGPSGFIPQLWAGSPDGKYQMQLGVVAASLGHGTIVQRLVNSPNGYARRFGIVAGFDLVSIGAQAMVGDVLSPLSFVAARATLKPLVFLHTAAVYRQPHEFDHKLLSAPLGRWLVGVTAATDVIAPNVKDLVPSPTQQVDLFQSGMVNAVGIENQIVVTDTDLNTLIFYADVNMLNRVGNVLQSGVGTHVGVESMTHMGSIRFKLDLEGNVGSPGYIPRYFDETYYVDRVQLLGTRTTKFATDAPSSYGYLARGSVVFGDMFAVFSEMQDQFPVVTTEGANSARYSLGGSFDWLMFGGTLRVSQAGVQDYLADAFGPGFLFIAEGRVSLLWDYLQVIGRFFMLNGVDGANTTGGFVGLEINLGL